MEFDPWYPIKAYKEISKWIIKFHSQKRCPNPCFRLELFKFMIDLDCSGMCDLKLFRKKVIITLFELCDNYKSLTLKQLPKFDPEDLKAILFKGIKQMYKCTLIFQKRKKFLQHLNNLVYLELSGINLHGKLSALRYMQNIR